MSFIELARNRFSERHFDSRPVETEKLDLILEAGRVAPTACNCQPQVIYVIKSEMAMEKAKSTRASLGGFIHVPAKGMSIETVAEGLAIATKEVSHRLCHERTL